jgi:hypothetical protein
VDELSSVDNGTRCGAASAMSAVHSDLTTSISRGERPRAIRFLPLASSTVFTPSSIEERANHVLGEARLLGEPQNDVDPPRHSSA